MSEYRDAEALVAAFFRPRLEEIDADARTVTAVPNPRPPVLLVVRRTGGTAANRRLDQPIMTMTLWHQSRTEAAGVAGELRSIFYSSWGRRMEEVSGLYYDPDPASEADRYSWSTQLWIPSRIL